MSESSPPHRIIVTGATSIVGQFLLPKLAYAGYEVHAISRKDSSNPAMIQKNIFWHSGDISYPKQVPCPSAIALVHLAPLWLLPPCCPFWIHFRFDGSLASVQLAYSARRVPAIWMSGASQRAWPRRRKLRGSSVANSESTGLCSARPWYMIVIKTKILPESQTSFGALVFFRYWEKRGDCASPCTRTILRTPAFSLFIGRRRSIERTT